MKQLEKSMQPNTEKKFTFIASFPKIYSDEELSNLKIIRNKEEQLLFEEVTENVKKDLEELGIKINYSIIILINELAWNLVIFSRLKHYLNIKDIISYEPNYRLGEIHQRKEYDKKYHIKFYEAIDNIQTINPLYSNFLFKLEKNINKILSLLNLLPEQQLQRHKTIFVEKMKNKLFEVKNKEGAYSIEAVAERKQKL